MDEVLNACINRNRRPESTGNGPDPGKR